MSALSFKHWQQLLSVGSCCLLFEVCTKFKGFPNAALNHQCGVHLGSAPLLCQSEEMFPKHLLVVLLFNRESGKKNTFSFPSSLVTHSLACVLAGYSPQTSCPLSLLVTRAVAAASWLRNLLPSSARYPVYPVCPAPQATQELAREGLQPGLWDLLQAFPWLYRQLGAFSGAVL